MTTFEITIDTSIEGAIKRIVQEELGDISVQIITKDQSHYQIEIDKTVSVSDDQQTKISNSIEKVFADRNKIISSSDWK